MHLNKEDYKFWSVEIGFYPGSIIRVENLLRGRADYSRAIHAVY